MGNIKYTDADGNSRYSYSTHAGTDIDSDLSLESVVNSLGTVATNSARSSTATVGTVGASASNGTLLSSNANRIGAAVHNASTAILYLKCGTTASTVSYTVKIGADAYYEVPFKYTGRIDGIWSAANGFAAVTEFS